MADKNVTVRVDVAAGPDQLTPALKAQAAQAETTAQALARIKREAQASGQVPLIPAGVIGRVAAGAAVPPPPPIAQARMAAEAQGGGPRAGAILALQQVQQATQAFQTNQAGLGGLGEDLQRSTQQAQGLAGALSAIPGVGPAIAAGVSVGITAVSQLAQSFMRVRDSIGDVISANRTLLQDLREGRTTGTASADALRRALTPQQQVAFATAQTAGDQGAQTRILQEAQQRHQQTLQEEGGDPAVRMAAIQAELEQVEAVIRSGEYRRARTVGMGAVASPEELRQGVLRSRGVDEWRIGNLGNAPLTQAQIQEIAGVGGARSVQAQAGLEALRNAQRAGAPSLQPGALTINDLPQLFQSRQTEVGDIHAQIQQEAVRDQRDEARFNRQMALWEQIQRDIQGLGREPAPPRDRD
jgi:hypothetical protein